MRYICFVSFGIFVVLTVLLGMALFDIVDLPENLHNLFGLIDVVALAIFFKTFIRIYKYTHRD